MRKDLNKLLCERARRGGYRNHHDYRRDPAYQPDWDPEDGGGPKSEGMRRRYGYNGKEFNENLAPLRGIIRKAVGRPWDKFYSELAEVFDFRSVINQHILLHLYQYVEVKDVYEKEGELWVRQSYGTDRKLRDSGVEYYVDPRDKILKKNKHHMSWRERERGKLKQKQVEQAKVFRKLEDGSELHKIGDIWFHFQVSEAPLGRWTDVKKVIGEHVFYVKELVGQGGYDELTQTLVVGTKDRPAFYRHSKRSASHKLLKQAGIVGGNVNG